METDIRKDDPRTVGGIAKIGLVRRVLGYVVGAVVASLMYVGCVSASITSVSPGGTGFGFSLVFSLFLWFSGGFGAALLLMAAPWGTAVFAYRRLHLAGRIYFPLVGALFLFVIGCVTASISPKPLWIEDQTFLEGALIAATRQGICFLVSGAVFGASYWLIGEKHLSFS